MAKGFCLREGRTALRLPLGHLLWDNRNVCTDIRVDRTGLRSCMYQEMGMTEPNIDIALNDRTKL